MVDRQTKYNGYEGLTETRSEELIKEVQNRIIANSLNENEIGDLTFALRKCHHCNCAKRLEKELEEIKKIRENWSKQDKKTEFLKKLSEMGRKELKDILEAQKVIDSLNRSRIKSSKTLKGSK